jgi:hypothetical protein
MTGMGDDCADGLLEMKQADALTIARTKRVALSLECQEKPYCVGPQKKSFPLLKSLTRS